MKFCSIEKNQISQFAKGERIIIVWCYSMCRNILYLEPLFFACSFDDEFVRYGPEKSLEMFIPAKSEN